MKHRHVQASVTNFLYCKDEYLFLKRSTNKSIDPGKLNGIGGKVEEGEDYVQAAIRETKEETGYIITPHNMKLVVVGRLEEFYEKDWIMCFFKIKVPHKNIPLGSHTEDGELLWLHKDKVIKSKYDLVDDLHYSFKEIVGESGIVFFSARVGDNFKIKKISKSILSSI